MRTVVAPWTGADEGGCNRSMKILMLNSNRRFVGTYYRCLFLARELVRRGHQVTLMTVSPSEPFRHRRLVEQGVTIVEGPMVLDRPGVLSSPLDVALRVREIVHGRYDVVCGFDYHPNVSWPVYLTRQRVGYAFLSDWCDWFAGGHNRWRANRLLLRLDAFLEERIRFEADVLTVINRVLLERALSIGIPRQRIHLIRSGCDPDFIRPLDRRGSRTRMGLPQDVPMIGYMPKEAPEMVVRSFARVRRHVPSARLLVIGKPLPALDLEAERLGVAEAVLRTGFLHEELPIALSCCDVALLLLRDDPKDRGRWPHKLGDYMAAALPVVTCPVGDVGDFVGANQVGLLVPMEAEGIAEGLMQLLGDPPLAGRLGANGRRVVEEQLNWRVLAGQFEQALHGALEYRRRPKEVAVGSR